MGRLREDAALVADAFGLADEVEHRGGADLLAHVDLGEVGVDRGAGDDVALDLAEERVDRLVAEDELDEDLVGGLVAHRHHVFVRIQLDGLGFAREAREDGGDGAGPAHTARLAGTVGGARCGVEFDCVAHGFASLNDSAVRPVTLRRGS